MPALLTRSPESGSAPANSRSGIWSKHRESITFDQLQKFWSELSLPKRQGLLKLDKHTLLEQARKNLYCSRCNGLLLEGFSQIVMHGKALQQEDATLLLSDRMLMSSSQDKDELEVVQNPSIHPWGGLTTTKDGFLTVLDCFLCARSLKLLENVFDSARAREHERELLYPDACGGGVRGWTSQGTLSYGRGHGTRETCALHTARLSCDTLVDFWSVLSEETRLSLLQMKEEDFIERLMYRFDSKRFCRDCRKNVLREFKELKELKRMKKEPCCTIWFCAADSSFSYEVSEDSVQADWHQSFTETVGIYHYFEWAIGTGEGKTDILSFQDVGMNGRAQVNGLDLGGLSACFITLRAWRYDGRCTELSVKAHALKGKQCIHRRLIVRDGFVTITQVDNIRRFFEQAEEVEEAEDDDVMDKDGNELDGDNSRPQKHAKSPELAREFLLDAATVIFKEQVEKAFREGAARQNAHSIFVCLALKLLEKRLHIACKEIITLEKQIKLLEEEEKEKHDEEKRKERKRTKEREKKLRRKDRLKGKERGQESELMESQLVDDNLSPSSKELTTSTKDESANTPDSEDIVSEPGDDSMLTKPDSLDIAEELPSSQAVTFQRRCVAGEDFSSGCFGDSFTVECTGPLRRKLRFRKDRIPEWYDKRQSCFNTENFYRFEIDAHSHPIASSRGVHGLHRPPRERFMKNNERACDMQVHDTFHGSNTRMQDRYDPQSCSCNQQRYYRAKDEHSKLTSKTGKGSMVTNGTELSGEMPRQMYRVVKHNNGTYLKDNSDIPKGRCIRGTVGKEVMNKKQVWEPLGLWKRCSQGNSELNASCVAAVDPPKEIIYKNSESDCQQPPKIVELIDDLCSYEHSAKSENLDSLNCSLAHGNKHNASKSDMFTENDNQAMVVTKSESECYPKICPDEEIDCHSVINNCNPLTSPYSSDNCFSCLSEGDSSTCSLSVRNAESSSTSDSEDVIQQLDCLNTPICTGNSYNNLLEESPDENSKTNRGHCRIRTAPGFVVNSHIEANPWRENSRKTVQESHDGGLQHMDLQQQYMLNTSNYGMHVPVFPPQAMSYYNRSAPSWLSAPSNGIFPFPQINCYGFSRPLGYSFHQPNLSSDFSMHYTPMQPLSSLELDASRHPVHQIANNIYLVSSKDLCKNSVSVGFQQFNNAVEPIIDQQLPQTSVSDGQLSSKSVLPVNCDINAKQHDENPSFSLFHYGGPMAALAASCCSNSSSPHERSTGDFASKLPTHTCPKEETKIQEYSLFSARNGTGFSFF